MDQKEEGRPLYGAPVRNLRGSVRGGKSRTSSTNVKNGRRGGDSRDGMSRERRAREGGVEAPAVIPKLRHGGSSRAWRQQADCRVGFRQIGRAHV